MGFKRHEKIALSASFGINKEEFLSYSEYTNKNAQIMKNALKSFDYLSCRELSGKEIFRDVFNLNSDWIFDPVFLIDKKKYDEILQHATTNNADKIVSYVLDDNQEYEKIYNYLSNKLNIDVVKINNKNYLVEDWLKSIRDCKYLITDSFHGVCFALIFNKPFVCVRNKARGGTRFETIIEYFDISDNFVSSIDDIYKNKLNFNMNFKSINEKISVKRNGDLEVIRKILLEDYSNNPNAKENKIQNLKFLGTLNLPKNSLKLKINYFRCKLLSNLTFGKKRKHYIQKKHELKYQIKMQDTNYLKL